MPCCLDIVNAQTTQCVNPSTLRIKTPPRNKAKKKQRGMDSAQKPENFIITLGENIGVDVQMRTPKKWKALPDVQQR